MSKKTTSSLPPGLGGDTPLSSTAPALSHYLVARHECEHCGHTVPVGFNLLSPCPACKQPTRWLPLYDGIIPESERQPETSNATEPLQTAPQPTGGETTSGCVVCGQPAPDGPLCAACNEKEAGLPAGEREQPVDLNVTTPPLSPQASDALDLLYGRAELHSQGAIAKPGWPEEKFADSVITELTRPGYVIRPAFDLIITEAGRAYVDETRRKLDEAALFDTEDGVPAYMQLDVLEEPHPPFDQTKIVLVGKNIDGGAWPCALEVARKLVELGCWDGQHRIEFDAYKLHHRLFETTRLYRGALLDGFDFKIEGYRRWENAKGTLQVRIHRARPDEEPAWRASIAIQTRHSGTSSPGGGDTPLAAFRDARRHVYYSAAFILEYDTPEALRLIRHVDDQTRLRDLLKVEQAKKKRLTVIRAIQTRLETLAAPPPDLHSVDDTLIPLPAPAAIFGNDAASKAAGIEVDPAVAQNKLNDLPERQREFLLALATGKPVIKNAATRLALLTRKLIYSHIGSSREWWGNIRMTPLGEAVAAALLKDQANGDLPPAPDQDRPSVVVSAEPVISLDVDGTIMRVTPSEMEQALRSLAEQLTAAKALNGALLRDNKQLKTSLDAQRRESNSQLAPLRDALTKLRSDMEELRTEKDQQIAALQAEIAAMKSGQTEETL